MEVNIAHEESKFGISEEDAIQLVEEIAELENVRIKGLMTIAPYVENAEDNRLYFRKIKDLSVDIAAKNIDNVSMEILSMGMTGDYEVAIEEELPWFVSELEFLEHAITTNNNAPDTSKRKKQNLKSV